MSVVKLQNFINGKMCTPVSDDYFNNFEPATGQVIRKVPDSDERDVALAVKAAQNAFPYWSGLRAIERAKYMRAIASQISDRLEEFAQAESDDVGKPITLAKTVDIPRAIQNFEFFADIVQASSTNAYETDTRNLNYSLRQPIGVVGCISPWNLPLYLFSWKIAPALAVGCTVVAKPSELTPQTAFLLSKICQEIGLPDGVLNIVHGYGYKAGEAIVTHKDVKAISFTGGTVTGRSIAEKTAKQFKKVSLEMGGKNPYLVFEDADFNKAVNTAVNAGFRNQGQICLCGSRFYIHKSLYNRFRDAIVEKVNFLKIGDPQDTSTEQGAIVSELQYNKVLSYIDLAKQEGGKILCGGDAVHLKGRCANGWFIQPTVIEGLSSDCRINQEEIFGPVITLHSFEAEEEALELANGTDYGLAASIWTSNLARAHRVSSKLEFGIVWVNCWMERDLRTPFGGVKNSGMGREGGSYALDFFTELKNITIQIG